MHQLSATDRVYDVLRKAITSGELAVGSRHSIYQMAEMFGVSRTPVRDAVLRLADTGMLRIERNRGVVVQGLTVDEIRQIFEARLLIEVPAAEHAARHADAAFLQVLDSHLLKLRSAVEENSISTFMQNDRELHEEILRFSANMRIVGFVAHLRDATQAWDIVTANTTRDLQHIEVEHLPVVNAIRNGDAHAAGKFMREHLRNTALLLMRQVSTASGEEAFDVWPQGIAPA